VKLTNDILHFIKFSKAPIYLLKILQFYFQNVSNKYCEWMEDFQEIITLENRLMFARPWR